MPPRPAWRTIGRMLAVTLSAALVMGLPACQAQVLPSPAPGGAPSVAAEADAETRLLEQIRAEIGSAPCTQTSQCRTLPVGAKACGGPATWWPWSTVNARGDRLQAWAQEVDRLQRQRFERSGMLSDCRYVADPGAACVAQRCVLQGRS